MCPRNLSGVGTLSDAGRWSTSSVEMRESVSELLMSAVYSASCFCAGACPLCAEGRAHGATMTTSASSTQDVRLNRGTCRAMGISSNECGGMVPNLKVTGQRLQVKGREQ